MDILQRDGMYPMPPQAPSTLGVEFSGTIEGLGSKEPSEESSGGNESKENDFQIGDNVFGLVYGGAYAEYVAANTKMLLKKPSWMSWEIAAGIPEVSSKLQSPSDNTKGFTQLTSLCLT
jgi:NADPH2:quinone reductase